MTTVRPHLRFATLSALAVMCAACVEEPQPPLDSVLRSLATVELPPFRSSIPNELPSDVSSRIEKAIDGKRSFKGWRCEVGQNVDLDTSFTLSCAIGGTRRRLFLRDQNIPADSPAAAALRDAERGDKLVVAGQIPEGPKSRWVEVSVENCGLDLKIPAENGIFITVDIENAKRVLF